MSRKEEAIVEPLSGIEIIEAIKHQVGLQLQRDCFLSPNSAYEHFFAEVKISLKAVDCGRIAEVNTTVVMTQGPAPDPDDEDAKSRTDISQSIEQMNAQPPNVVRKETGQPVPVLVDDGSGNKERKTVKYEKDKPTGKAGAKK